MKSLEGILFLWTETGTEGGRWAFQDNQYISKQLPSHGIFSSAKVWDVNNPSRQGTMGDSIEVFLNNAWLELPDPITQDADYSHSSLFRGETRGDRDADKRLMEKYGFNIIYAEEDFDERFGKDNWYLEDPRTAVVGDKRYVFGGTPDTNPNRPYGVPQNGLTRGSVTWIDGEYEPQRLSNTLLVEQWSYYGLHELSNGDLLSIYHPDTGAEVWSGEIDLTYHKLFTEDAFGFWIHADQKGIDRETWAKYFFNKYPARLQT